MDYNARSFAQNLKWSSKSGNALSINFCNESASV